MCCVACPLIIYCARALSVIYLLSGESFSDDVGYNARALFVIPLPSVLTFVVLN
jgi:hypothetical protein